MLKKTYYLSIIILSLLALIATSYLVYERYTPEPTGTLCNFGGSFNCLLVNNSYYATVFSAFYLDIIPYYIGFDIPFSILGVITYLLLIILGIIGYKNYNLRIKNIRNKHIPKIIFIITGITFAFSLYLTYIEAFVIKTWCIFCVTQAILVTTMLVLTYFYKQKLSK